MRQVLWFVQAHGVLMTVAWAIILPISIVIAHSLRSTLKNDVWFQVHRALGVSYCSLDVGI